MLVCPATESKHRTTCSYCSNGMSDHTGTKDSLNALKRTCLTRKPSRTPRHTNISDILHVDCAINAPLRGRGVGFHRLSDRTPRYIRRTDEWAYTPDCRRPCGDWDGYDRADGVGPAKPSGGPHCHSSYPRDLQRRRKIIRLDQAAVLVGTGRE
jgi:hypothetical protein